MDFLWYHKVIETIYHVIAIALNAVLLMVIQKFTPGRMADYRWMFQVTCVSDIVLSVSFLPWQFVPVWNDEILVIFPNSFFAPVSSFISFWILVIGSHMLFLNMMFLPVPFVYRYMQLRSARGVTFVAKCTLVVVPLVLSIVGLVSSYNVHSHNDEYHNKGLRVLADSGLGLVNDNISTMNFVALPIISVKLFVDLFVFVLNSATGYSVIIFCEYRMLRKLRSMDNSAYASTRRMQADISRALVALAVSPLLSAVIPVVGAATCIFLHLNVGYTSAVMPFAVTAVTVVNPLTTCYFVLPYRRAVASVYSGTKVSDIHFSSVYNSTTKDAPSTRASVQRQ
ncbi:7TM GPCR protein, partial [Aphelenchoides avenae]